MTAIANTDIATTDIIWEAQRHLALLGCYTANIDGLDGNQTQEAIQKAIARYNNGETKGWLDAVKATVLEMQPNPRTGTPALLADINRICNLLTLTMPEQKAYIAASIWKETAGLMQPVEESFWQSPQARQKYLRSKSYWPHYGRGDIQLTWLNNYQWATLLFTPVHVYVNGKVPDTYPTNFVANPNNLLQPDISLIIAIIGMYTGYFRRNHNIKRYINPEKVDFYNARKIVNGMVPKVAKEIAEKAEEFTQEFRKFDTH